MHSGLYYDLVITSAYIIFDNFLGPHSTFPEKKFCQKLSFLTDSPNSPPLNGPNPLSMTKVFVDAP